MQLLLETISLFSRLLCGQGCIYGNAIPVPQQASRQLLGHRSDANVWQHSNNIRKLRFERGEMTQKDLAKAVGCARQTNILLEQEKYVPSLAFLIARVFDQAFESVFELEEAV